MSAPLLHGTRSEELPLISSRRGGFETIGCTSLQHSFSRARAFVVPWRGVHVACVVFARYRYRGAACAGAGPAGARQVLQAGACHIRQKQSKIIRSTIYISIYYLADGQKQIYVCIIYVIICFCFIKYKCKLKGFLIWICVCECMCMCYSHINIKDGCTKKCVKKEETTASLFLHGCRFLHGGCRPSPSPHLGLTKLVLILISLNPPTLIHPGHRHSARRSHASCRCTKDKGAHRGHCPLAEDLVQ